jgi:phosphate transport system substrate-binding protein
MRSRTTIFVAARNPPVPKSQFAIRNFAGLWFAVRPAMRLPLLSALLSALAASTALADDVIRVAGSNFLVQPFVLAAPALKKQNVELKVAGDSNTPTAIAAVGAKECDLAVSTRPLLPVEQAAFPDRPMPETTIGFQALVLSVSNEVWTGGIRALGKADITRIYEGTVKNWKELGGPNRPIKFYNPEPGKGVWEFFVTWLYGDMRKAPAGRDFETVGSSEEAQNLIQFNAGAIGILPAGKAESKGTHGLAMRDEKGALIQPTRANVRKNAWPITRPIIVVSAYRPTGPHRKVIEFLLSAEGQEIVRRSDMVSVAPEASE